MRLRLHPTLVPQHIDGFAIRSDARLSRFSAVGTTEGGGRAEHRRAELELNLPVGGHADYLIGDRHVRLEAGQLLWLLPDQNRLVIDASADFQTWVLVFRPRLVRRVLTAPAPHPLTRRGTTGLLLSRLPAPEARALTALYKAVPVGAGRDVFNAGLAYCLARSWVAFERATPAQLPVELHPAVKRAAHLLCESVEDLSNRALAARTNLSAQRLSRLFKSQTGIALSEFRNRQRLDRFLRLIDETDRPNLMELALEAGFGSYVQCHRVFRSALRENPAAYARRRKRLDSTIAPFDTELKSRY
jgi:AraC-like DNA-binding protein